MLFFNVFNSFQGGNGKCNPGRMQVAGWFLGSMAKKQLEDCVINLYVPHYK